MEVRGVAAVEEEGEGEEIEDEEMAASRERRVVRLSSGSGMMLELAIVALRSSSLMDMVGSVE